MRLNNTFTTNEEQMKSKSQAQPNKTSLRIINTHLGLSHTTLNQAIDTQQHQRFLSITNKTPITNNTKTTNQFHKSSEKKNRLIHQKQITQRTENYLKGLKFMKLEIELRKKRIGVEKRAQKWEKDNFNFWFLYSSLCAKNRIHNLSQQCCHLKKRIILTPQLSAPSFTSPSIKLSLTQPPFSSIVANLDKKIPS